MQISDKLEDLSVFDSFFILVQETDSGEHLSRRKSLKESIRRSFRRLRSRKGSRGGAERTPKKEDEAPASPTPEAVASPVSRLVEENRVDESVLSMVRCLYFVDTFVRDGKALTINSVHTSLHLI